MAKEIELTQGLIALVDDADYADLSFYKWYALRADKGVYAARRNALRTYPQIILMHRYLIDAPEGVEVDHINNNPLDNRRVNLRLATKSQNGASTRRFDSAGNLKKTRGIGFYRGKWTASIKVNGKSKYLGRFVNEEDAKAAYDEAAKYHFGEFAKLNSTLNAN